MSNLLNVLSKRDKTPKGKMIFDHFIQNIKSTKYISILSPPLMEELEEKMIELPEQDPESKNSTKV
jgi:hypothetical protein